LEYLAGCKVGHFFMALAPVETDLLFSKESQFFQPSHFSNVAAL
jgi:hypothetical protein